MEIQEVNFSSPFTFSSLCSDRSIPLEEEFDGGEPLKKNLWGFDKYVWREIREKIGTVEQLYAAIQDLHDEIRTLKEQFRDLAIPLPDDLICEKNNLRGVSGSYFLSDIDGNKKYLIKPLDEDIGCLNSELYSTLFNDFGIREDMPPYRSSLREALAFKIASMIGVSSVIPKTDLVIYESANFYDFSDAICAEERNRYFGNCGDTDREKLCSAQEYVPNAKPLFEAVHDFQMLNLCDEEIAKRFDQQDFEETNILIWTTFDTDAHMGNILVYPKGVDEVGNEVLGFKKIDNGLAFPDSNTQLRNSLTYLPNAEKELSDEAKAKVLAIDVDQLAEQFEKMGLESAIPALRERIPFLQSLVQKEGITIKKINKALSKLGWIS